MRLENKVAVVTGASSGTYGKMPCEFEALEKLNGRWETKKTTPLLVGSYISLGSIPES